MKLQTVGIDVGYLYAKLVMLDSEGSIAQSRYQAHNGNVRQTLRKLLTDLPGDCPVVLSGGETRRWQNNDEDWVHDVGALVERAAHLDRKINAVLHVGASGVALITLDEKGDLRAYETNTLCAAGTGSFLDEQAARLGIDYAQTAVPDPEGEIPVIATRCSVFAKSDLVHRQQEGFSRPALWAGLCEGMTSTLFQTLLKGRHLPDNTLITGGVSRNTFVIEAARRRHPGQIVATEDGHLAVAIGAAWLARKTQPLLTVEHLKAQLENGEVQAASNSDRHPALKLLKSSYPSFDVHREWQDDADNEIRLNRSLLAGPIPVWMGVDIGSTSTKLAALDENSDVICDIYRRTAGEPLVATRLVLQAFHQLGLEAGVVWEVRGLATTGSGRKLAGMAFGADAIINEITAHARGAIATAGNDIETIFEIGGQDAKYIRIHNGLIRDSNMNFVCSAGTGSFVEEQARKLGFPVQTVGSVTEGVAPPVTSDRCTVFMEQDVVKLLAAGHTRADAMGGVLYSVVKNYLNKVVGNRQVSSRRVVFQGATARNRGLVAAFENLLGVEVVVSPYCHVMGCIGAALVSQERVVAESRFLGFSKLDRKIEIQHSRCELCSNVCKITHAQVAGSDEETSWGYLCGREPGESARAMTHDRAFRVVSRMERQAVAACNKQARPDRPVAGLPLSLSGRALLPFWAAICRELGIPLQPGTETTEHVKQQGAALAAADFCFPVKAHLGHLKTLLEHPEVDCLLVPFYISEEMNKHTSNSLVCPYVESSPSLFRAVVPEQDGRKVLSPILDFRWSLKRQAKALLKELLPVYSDLKEGAVRKALAVAHKTRAEFSTKLVQEGEKILAEAQADGRAVLVFVGRPYNVRDLGLNLALPRHFAQHGYDVLPHEMLPFKPEILGIEFQNIYWSYGQRILSALRQVGAQDNLFAVYLSNFNCGPDSFLLTYAEEILQDKPFLVLELDEHSSEGGYLTRIEAFLDVIDNVGKASSERNIRVLHPANKEFRGRTIWFPPLHPIVVRMFAAAFRKYGFDGQALPSETVTSFERGRSAVRGSECLPTCSTIGAFLDLMAERQLDPDKQAFFMATAPGPCRFGQYELLHRMVLDKAGYPNVPIMSPSSFNSYQGMGESIRRLAWKGFLISDLLYKARCKVAPYERLSGATEALTEQWIVRFEKAIEGGEKLEPLMRSAMQEFAAIPVTGERKPLVGIVGEIYVRCNTFTNDDLVRSIEEFGGEAWLAPVSEWFLYTAQSQAWLAQEGLNGLAARGLSVLKNRFLNRAERHWYQVAKSFLADRVEPSMADVIREGEKDIPLNFEGEAIITVGRARLFAQRDNVDMVVNAAPFGCMPGTLTTAILRNLQDEMGIPVVGMFYDGTPGLNRSLEPFLNSLKNGLEAESQRLKQKQGHSTSV